MSRAYCQIAPSHPIHAAYHDYEYGFATEDERMLFERLCLEIMQAGLSWEIILKKRKYLNLAFNHFRVTKVAAYGGEDIKRLLKNPNIIRNKLKINAIIHNARVVLGMRQSHCGFAQWLADHKMVKRRKRTKSEWVKLFKQTFKFTGDEITGEFLMSIGYLPGAHWKGCKVYYRLLGCKYHQLSR